MVRATATPAARHAAVFHQIDLKPVIEHSFATCFSRHSAVRAHNGPNEEYIA
jgi:hypothetical protein